MLWGEIEYHIDLDTQDKRQHIYIYHVGYHMKLADTSDFLNTFQKDGGFQWYKVKEKKLPRHDIAYFFCCRGYLSFPWINQSQYGVMSHRPCGILNCVATEIPYDLSKHPTFLSIFQENEVSADEKMSNVSFQWMTPSHR